MFRATQLLKFKEIINQLNNELLKSEKIKNVWRHIVCFKKYGRDHTGVNDTTRRARSIFKIALLN